MVRDSPTTEDGPSFQDVLDALDDPDCRRILSEINEPMTANELTDACDIPQSTMYRKLDLLRDASLVRELIAVGPEGGRITRYERDVISVNISVTEDDTFSFTIDRPARAADERLADMWSKMGDEL